jgi:hypothetical protein
MFSHKVGNYRRRFENDKFDLTNGGNLSKSIKQGKVPNKPGVYIITGILNQRKRVLYIGMAGTMKRDGTFKKQMLPKRLTAVQNYSGRWISRAIFFQQKMEELIPAYAEIQLLQSYFNDNRVLPLWNHEI